ncbi:MAG: twin-arginine translocase subunit TatC [Planctomycetota bacterium]|nr:twin-arginine translocase subunit TatC [Planctomycetota bacterium]
MSLSDHLDELRTRLWRSVLAVLVGMIVSFCFWRELMEFVIRPFREASRLVGAEGEIVTPDPADGFLQVIKLCFITGVVFVSPLVLWQLWGFVAAGLYDREKRYVRLFFPVSLGLFALGLVCAYVLLIPFGLRFLVGWNEAIGAQSWFSLKAYLSMCLTMVFGMGLVFQLPLIMLFLQAVDIVPRATFLKGWRVAIVMSFVLGMILTDPSPVTQIAMAVPIVGLYFLGIWGGQFVGENAVAFRWYKAWPLVIAIAFFVAMLVYADQLNDWAAGAFGMEEAPKEAPAKGR